MDRTLKKASYPLDTVRYFSSEKSSLYPYFLLPLVVAGLLYLAVYELPTLFVYLAVAFLLTAPVYSTWTLILYFPLISVSAVLGLMWIFRVVGRIKK